jgi:hypothetical protein
MTAIINKQTTTFHQQSPTHKRVPHLSLRFNLARMFRKELAEVIIEPLDVVLAVTRSCS